MNCLYNNLVTSAKTPECNGSSKPLGEKLKYAARQQGSALVLPPLSLQHRSFLPEYKSLVTCGLQRIKTLRFMYVSLKHQRCFGFIISGNTRTVNVSEMHVLLKGLRVLYVEQWKAKTWSWNRGHEASLLKGSFWLSSRTQPYFSSICPRASHLGLKFKCWWKTQSLLVFLLLVIPAESFFLINACSQP